MIEKEQAIETVKRNVSDKNLRKHMYAVSAIMKELAIDLNEDTETWELVGLLHDIDYERTEDEPEKHALVSAEMVAGKLPENCCRAIKSHNFKNTGIEPSSNIDYALISADAISGLIVATALVMPDSKLEQVRVESVLKKFDDNSFAKSIDRDRILYCEKLGLNKEEFIRISLRALKKISDKLGL